MNADHILVIDGNQATDVSLNRGQLLSVAALYEYSTIIWIVDSIEKEIARFHPNQQGVLEHSLMRRMMLVGQWVESGHSLIVVGPSAVPIYHTHSSGATVSARVNQLFPLYMPRLQLTEGKKMEVSAEPPGANEILAPLLETMSYRATLANEAVVPLIFAKRATIGEKIVVGGHLDHGKGKIFFIPNFSVSGDKTDKSYRQLAKLPDCVLTKLEELPEWTSIFRSADEGAALARIEDLNSKRDRIDALITDEIAQLHEHLQLKHLLSGTGVGFLLAVKNALIELGLCVVDGPNSRADLIASGQDRYFAIEAKGIDGPVRERQYRQVERWMAELNNALHSDTDELEGDPEITKYAECVNTVAISGYDGRDAKGLLIVGTFRKTGLNERDEEDFPNAVVRLLGRTDTCGLTGVQLFGLVMAARVDASLKPVILKEIIETRGVLSRCRDWTSFLTIDKSSPQTVEQR